MKGRNSSRYYRKNSRKKRKLRNILIISAVCLVVLFLLFVIFGNRLNKKVEENRGGQTEEQTTAISPQNAATYSIAAYPVDVTVGTDVSAQMKSLYSAGIKSVSLRLTDSNGKLLIRSDIAMSLGYQSKADSLGDLSTAISKAKYYSMFTSTVFDLQFLSENDAKQRAVMLAYEAALAAEITEKGADEVIVRAPDADATHTELLVDFAESVRSINDSVVLGVALPKEFFYGESSSEDVAKLVASFDIVGIDVSEVPNEVQDTLGYIESVFAESNLKYYVLRYNMRVILPSVSDEQNEELTEVLSENSIQNWQKIS